MSEGFGTDAPSTKTRAWPAVAAVAAMASLLAVVGILLLSPDDTVVPAGDDDEPPPSTSTVRLEPVAYRSDAPFAESIVTLSDDDLSQLTSSLVAVDDAGTVSGDLGGLYAAAGRRPPCDTGRLIRALADDPAVSAAWADAAQVEPGSVADAIRSWSAVVLTRDTAVTNHTYQSGSANPYASVLQAGTPVLVDDRGTPRARCSCGNPLQPPDRASAADTELVGEVWAGFDTSEVITVAPAPAPVSTIETVDLDSGDTISTPVGAVVELDGVLASTTDGILVRSDDSVITTVVPDPARVAFDDGAGGIVYALGTPTADVHETLESAPSDATQRSIWYLPAGATHAEPLIANEDPTVWHHLLGVGQLGESTYVVFSPLRAVTPDDGVQHPEGPIVALDITTGAQTVLAEDGIGWEFRVSSVSFGGDRLLMERGDEVPYWSMFDADLSEVPIPCGRPDMSDAEWQSCPRWAALDDNGDMNFFATDIAEEFAFIASDELVVENPTTRSIVGRHPMQFGIDTSHTRAGVVQVHNGTVVSWFRLGEGVDETSTTLFDLETGEAIDLSELLSAGRVSVLRAPLRRPVEPEPSGSPATSSPPAGDARSVDVRNALLPKDSCAHGGDGAPPIQLSEGTGELGDGLMDPEYVYAVVWPGSYTVVDLDDDGVEELVVAVACNWGGSLVVTNLLTLAVAADGSLSHLAPPFEEFGSGVRGVEAIEAQGAAVLITIGPRADGEGAGSRVEETWRLEDERWVEGD